MEMFVWKLPTCPAPKTTPLSHELVDPVYVNVPMFQYELDAPETNFSPVDAPVS